MKLTLLVGEGTDSETENIDTLIKVFINEKTAEMLTIKKETVKG